MDSEALSSLHSLEKWIGENGYAGYDPYDIKGNHYILTLAEKGNYSFPFTLLRETVFELFYHFPMFSRRTLKIKPAMNAKAMGLFASSFADLYLLEKDDSFKINSSFCLNWLKDNGSETPLGIAWGYPFDWQSRQLIPAGTPNGIVTTAAADAFWKHYRIFNDQEALVFCARICDFLSTLPVDPVAHDQICFSYTPLFINHVHNLNLFVAEFLIKTGMETANNSWVDQGNKAVNYTISNQMKNGAFDYNGPPEKPGNHIDNYHTGFVLRMLYSIWKLTGRKDVYIALNKCYRHYVSNFFENRTIPKLMPDRKYRIDIHACAESIHCLSELAEDFPEGLPLAENVLNWTIQNLQDKTGYFYYGILKSRFTGIPFKSKIPYIRWGQAWMLRALTSYLMAVKSSKA
ncbi:MAG: hypothetical protein JW830_04865 [Bacteroidales bacterium]|nr:hypothetical protein [Bacteroidales bacterium]